jgi:cation:H+ antiporter
LIDDEIPALLLVTLVTGALLFNLHVGVFDALVLLGITALFVYRQIKKRTDSPPEFKQAGLSNVSKLQAIVYLLLGLVLLIGSAEFLVWAASFIAETLGVSTAIIGLTIVALGTSLPELATTITCALKRQHDLVIGTIFGSNILNLLAVLPFPGLFSPGPIEPLLLSRDYLVVLVLTLLLSYYCYRGIKRKKMIGRVCGLIFLSIYCGWFTVMLIQLGT